MSGGLVLQATGQPLSLRKLFSYRPLEGCRHSEFSELKAHTVRALGFFASSHKAAETQPNYSYTRGPAIHMKSLRFSSSRP